jgi:hypothetical protein
MSEYKIVDPSKANVDLDVVTLVDYTIMSPTGAVLDPTETSEHLMPITLHLFMEDGLGRITSPDGRTILINKVGKLTALSPFPELTGTQRGDLNRILHRWKTGSIPLRWLDFGTHAMLLEDGDNLVTMPPGQRELVIDDEVWP